MLIFMDTPILPDETLYRMVKRSRPDTMTEDGRPTAALFEDVAVSVDRGGGRSDDAVLADMKGFFGPRLRALVKFGANLCFEKELTVCPAPTKQDEYHAEIFQDAERKELPISMLNALFLADHADVCYDDPSVQWTQSIGS